MHIILLKNLRTRIMNQRNKTTNVPLNNITIIIIHL